MSWGVKISTSFLLCFLDSIFSYCIAGELECSGESVCFTHSRWCKRGKTEGFQTNSGRGMGTGRFRLHLRGLTQFYSSVVVPAGLLSQQCCPCISNSWQVGSSPAAGVTCLLQVLGIKGVTHQTKQFNKEVEREVRINTDRIKYRKDCSWATCLKNTSQ